MSKGVKLLRCLGKLVIKGTGRGKKKNAKGGTKETGGEKEIPAGGKGH